MITKVMETNLDTILAKEVLLLNLLGRMVFTYPDPKTKAREWIKMLLDEDLFAETPLGAENENVQAGIRLLQDWTAASRDRPIDSVMLDLQTDNTHLFACVGEIIAPPWESVYFNRKRLVHQEQMLAVRAWYRKHGLVLEKLFVEADDHIGLELVFAAYLANGALKAKDSGDLEKYVDLVEAHRQFLAEHLLLWGGLWCNQVTKYAQTDYYRGIALTLKGSLEVIAAVTGIIMN